MFAVRRGKADEEVDDVDEWALGESGALKWSIQLGRLAARRKEERGGVGAYIQDMKPAHW